MDSLSSLFSKCLEKAPLHLDNNYKIYTKNNKAAFTAKDSINPFQTLKILFTTLPSSGLNLLTPRVIGI